MAICRKCGKTINRVKYCSKLCSFLDKIKIQKNGCWIWNSTKNRRGYGKFTYDNISNMAHIFSCNFYNGPSLTNKTWVLHSCDDPSCVNPAHLRWGDAKDNAQDRVKRQRGADRIGQKNNSAKLSAVDIRNIKKELDNNYRGLATKLASLYNVSEAIISHIKHGKNWSHIKN